ncbi:MAG: hypothetical protein P4L77_11970 [Sulfuriferula sp.]|nr:hypothetical protein [Sulfuriferula sp.]
MGAANLTTHLPILQVLEKAGTTPFTSAQPEKAGQTFVSGALVQLNAGYVQEWDGATIAAGILGVSESFGQNLGSNGAGAPLPPFGGITGTGAIQTYGSVPNQPNAVNIALGTPIADGRTLYIEPNQANIFEALFDNSNGAVAADYTPTQAQIGTNFGMTKDANGFWYVDGNKTGGSAIVQFVAFNPLYGSQVNAPVRFVFLAAAIQVN